MSSLAVVPPMANSTKRWGALPERVRRMCERLALPTDVALAAHAERYPRQVGNFASLETFLSSQAAVIVARQHRVATAPPEPETSPVLAAPVFERRAPLPEPAEQARARPLAHGASSAAPERPLPVTPAEVVNRWRAEGPLVHEPTGLAELDELTGGGPVYGSRWYVLGSPDAGKTALLVQWLDVWARRGIVVGLLAADEEPTDIVTRLAQRVRWTRAECEQRAGLDLDDMACELPAARMYGAAWTIEAAAADLAAVAAAAGKRAALFIDSLQTVRCDAERDDQSARAQVTARVWAIRDVATRYRMIVIATSEMNRASYRSAEAAAAAQDAGDMASAKESGAVEYSARVMLSLRSLKDDPDKIEAYVGKNKHGPRGSKLYLALNRTRMVITEADAPSEPDESAREAAAVAKERVKLLGVAAAVAHILAPKLAGGGLTARGLRAAVRAKLGRCRNADIDAAVALLGPAVVIEPGRGNAQLHRLDRDQLHADVVMRAGPLPSPGGES